MATRPILRYLETFACNDGHRKHHYTHGVFVVEDGSGFTPYQYGRPTRPLAFGVAYALGAIPGTPLRPSLPTRAMALEIAQGMYSAS